MTPIEYCAEKLERSGSSFTLGIRLLSRPRREAMMALYAFCREVDDIVDNTENMVVAATKLAWWRRQVALIYDGMPDHPVARALQPAVSVYGLPREGLEEILRGMEMDLQIARYETFADLETYCYRVAGVVGELSARIFGYRNPATLQYARLLGIALQLTNIIRDVGEDVRRDRIYLPAEDLRRFGVSEADLQGFAQSPQFQALMAFQAERAKHFYQEAASTLPRQDRRSQRPGIVMAAIYRALLAEIEADGFQVLRQKTLLTPAYKLRVALLALVRGRW